MFGDPGPKIGQEAGQGRQAVIDYPRAIGIRQGDRCILQEDQLPLPGARDGPQGESPGSPHEVATSTGTDQGDHQEGEDIAHAEHDDRSHQRNEEGIKLHLVDGHRGVVVTSQILYLLHGRGRYAIWLYIL